MDPAPAQDPIYRLARAILRLASRVAPRDWREEGLEEWEGELWALRSRGASGAALLRFCLDGVMHAAWRRREEGWGMRGFGEDVRLAARRLLRSPGFTAVTLLILALGIGVNTALFGALEQALRGASRYPAADRLVMVDLLVARTPEAQPDTFPWSFPKLQLARQRMDVVEGLAGVGVNTVTLTGAGDATRVSLEMVGPTYFATLGMDPILGRAFLPAEELPADGSVALLGHALWVERFGGNPDVIGQTLTLQGASFQVLGVMPAGFRGVTGQAQMWLPLAAYNALGSPGRLRGADAHFLRAVGRLPGDVTVEGARARLEGLGVALDDAFPDPSGAVTRGVTVVPFLTARVNPVARLAVAAVVSGGFLLLLIGCANVAGLLFARASSRRADVAVRAALGAGRGRLLRESLTESLLLTTAGGVVGVLLALWGSKGVAWAVRYALETSGTRRLEYLNPDALRVDVAALAIGLGLALAIGLVSGLFVYAAATRPELARPLKATAAGNFRRMGATGEALRGVLVSAQLALTLLLLAGAGLMASSLAKLSSVSLGFSNENVLALRFDAGPRRSADEARAFERDVLARVTALPGVHSAAVVPCPPVSGSCDVRGVRRIDDGPLIDYGVMEGILTYEVSSDYFEVLGADVLQGQTFAPSLGPEDAVVAIVSESAARKHFGGDALGHRIQLTHEVTEGGPAEIVGMVADVRYGTLEEEVLPTIYFSRSQAPSGYGTLLVHTDGDLEGQLDAVRAVVREIDPGLPLTDVTTLAQLVSSATARTRVLLSLLAAFATLGLLLCAVGIYGVVSYDVSRRQRETGLRLALGAHAGHVLRTLLGRPAVFAGLGGVIGLGAALLLTKRLGALLFNVEPGDPAVLATAMFVLVAVAIAAAWRPAGRALRLDPARTLRGE